MKKLLSQISSLMKKKNILMTQMNRNNKKKKKKIMFNNKNKKLKNLSINQCLKILMMILEIGNPKEGVKNNSKEKILNLEEEEDEGGEEE